MIKKIVICDRCGEECATNGEYYTIDIRIHNIDPTVGYFVEHDGSEKHYCEKCKNEIAAFINAFSLRKEIKNNKVKSKNESECENCRWIIDCINGEIKNCVMREQ